MLGVEAPGKQVRRGHKGQFVISKKDHGHKKFFGVVQLLSSVAAFGAALDGAGQLCEMQHAKMRFRMAFGKMGERTGNGFRSDQAEVVQIVGPGGVGIVGIDDASGERSAILGDAVKVVLIRKRIEFRDERAVLFDERSRQRK